jgi:biotin synthase
LGETEKEAADFIIEMYQMGISVGLFAFTNIKGTSLEDRSPPDLSSYRRIQVVRQLVSQGLLASDQIRASEDGSISIEIEDDKIREALSSGVAFQVTGCKGCNRPFYNERPRGPMYNYPRRLTEEEVLRAIEETNLVV